MLSNLSIQSMSQHLRLANLTSKANNAPKSVSQWNMNQSCECQKIVGSLSSLEIGIWILTKVAVRDTCTVEKHFASSLLYYCIIHCTHLTTTRRILRHLCRYLQIDVLDVLYLDIFPVSLIVVTTIYINRVVNSVSVGHGAMKDSASLDHES